MAMGTAVWGAVPGVGCRAGRRAGRDAVVCGAGEAAGRERPAVWYAGQGERRALMSGNWKMNPGSVGEAKALAKLVRANQAANEASGRTDLPDAMVFPPAAYLTAVGECLAGTGVKLGAQNVSDRAEATGAFTGELSAPMLRSLGCEHVLVGHSERRALYDETDAVVNAKVRLALGAGLRVTLCVGETLGEYEAELAAEVCAVQLKKGLAGVDVRHAEAGDVVIAYEPVWAIGTGLSATPEIAQGVHAGIREVLAQIWTPQAARAVVIQYGGSVTPETVDALMAMPDIDGCLVGGASLAADKFDRLVNFTSPLRPAGAPPRVLQASEVVACRNALGESPVWSGTHLHWVSALDKEVWTWNLADAPFKVTFDSIVGCVALREQGGLVVALEDAIVAYDPETRATTALADVLPERNQNTRPNDGRVDRAGNFVYGSYNSFHRGGSDVGAANAGLYRLDASSGAVTEVLDYKFRVSNGICFTGDGASMFFCDTPTRKVFQFDYSPTGALTHRRLVYSMPPHLAGGPDGAQVDRRGGLWIALSGASQVVRVDPAAGHVTHAVRLPVASPTSCTFGGPDLTTLYITTRGPDGGGLYACQVPSDLAGLPEPRFRG